MMVFPHGSFLPSWMYICLALVKAVSKVLDGGKSKKKACFLCLLFLFLHPSCKMLRWMSNGIEFLGRKRQDTTGENIKGGHNYVKNFNENVSFASWADDTNVILPMELWAHPVHKISRVLGLTSFCFLLQRLSTLKGHNCHKWCRDGVGWEGPCTGNGKIAAQEQVGWRVRWEVDFQKGHH